MNRFFRRRERAGWRWLMLIVFVQYWRLRPFPVGHAGGGGHYGVGRRPQFMAAGGGTADQIIWNIRLPRTLTGALVGANLALSGAFYRPS